jgi:hypothetical protein
LAEIALPVDTRSIGYGAGPRERWLKADVLPGPKSGKVGNRGSVLRAEARFAERSDGDNGQRDTADEDKCGAHVPSPFERE